MRSFSWRGYVVQGMKKREKICSFLDAIGRRSCGHSADWQKVDMWENRSFESSGARQLAVTLRCALSLSSDLHFDSRRSPACLSSACISLGMRLKTKFSPAVSSVQSLPPPRLSLSFRVTRFEKKNHFRSTQQSEHPSERSLSVATRSRSPGLTQLACNGWFKRKNAEFFPARSSCVLVNSDT